MRFSLASVAALAFAVVSAQDPNFNDVYKPTKGEEISAGKSYKVEWRLPATAKKGPISIILVGGATQLGQNVLSTIETGYDNSKLSYDWSVDASLGALAVYGLKFQLDSDATVFQWSNNFKIVGGGASGGNDTAVSSSSSSASSSATKPPSTVSTTTSTQTSVQTSGTTTVLPPTTTPPTTNVPPPTGTVPTSTPAANTTRPTVPPNAAAGYSFSGPLALVGGLAALMLAL